ncbi:MAG: 4a-hydroxytetrahydrobiopterin dehydratase [Firmicutes bacterium]|jgi:4a-hydroxytetrahydrobiopterin dehydratase|nr:4a-hydroxytetrahydrobiopterin dehydratase [Bacillota bacterium]
MGVLQEFQHKSCKPCEGGAVPFTKSQAEIYLYDMPGWELDNESKKISKTFLMKNFMSGVQLIQKIAELAEKEGHHPDLHLTDYRNLTIVLSTHAIGGLSENDFILASKIEELPKELKKIKGGA